MSNTKFDLPTLPALMAQFDKFCVDIEQSFPKEYEANRDLLDRREYFSFQLSRFVQMSLQNRQTLMNDLNDWSERVVDLFMSLFERKTPWLN